MKYYRDESNRVFAYNAMQTPRDGLVPMTETETEAHLNPVPTTEQLAATARTERDNRIQSVGWMRERHTDEIALGMEPTLTPEQYTALLTYIQALRDIPAQPGAPWDGGGELTPWPEKPNF